jgi:2-methylcitrate dehydratase
MAGSGAEKWAPESKETADHSLPYIATRAMFDGDIDNDSYAPDKLREPRVLAFMRKITVKEDPAFATITVSVPPTRLTATLDDGRRVTRLVDSMPGFPGQPISRADVERKFRSNVGKRWPQQRTDAVLKGLWDIDRTNDLSALLGGLSLSS